MKVRVHWVWEAVSGIDLHGWTVAVVDCLRATTSVAAALASGAVGVVPCDSEAAARRVDGAVLAGERGTDPIAGFDLGNSPAGFTPERVRGRTVALLTTNGTRAILASREAGADVVAAFALVNAGAVAARLGAGACARLAIVCAGRVGHFGLDDAFAAGALIERLGATDLDDSGRAARLLYESGRADPLALLRSSSAGRRLEELGYRDDVEFAARGDSLDVVPVLADGALRPTV